MLFFGKPEVEIEKKIVGFKRHEAISIEEDSLREAFLTLGKRYSGKIKRSLKTELKALGSYKKVHVFGNAKRSLAKLEKLSRSGELEVGGINYMARFLEALYGICDGAGISHIEGAYLQSESEAGCQTLIVQNKKDKTIRVIHTEEDSDYSRLKGATYPYKVVQFNIKGKKITSFLYPDIFGWGYAIGINENEGLFQVVDDLIPLPEYNMGALWSSAISFMTLDCGNKKLIKEFLKKVELIIPKIKFNGGYAIHFCWDGKTPEFKSYEFLYDRIVVSKAHEESDRSVMGQANLSLRDEIKPFTYSSIPPKGKKWSLAAAEFYVEMKERTKRLLDIGKKTNWINKDAEQSISQGLEILATPYVDITRSLNKKRQYVYNVTGLPSPWTVAHMVAYIGKGHLRYYLGKFTPKPLKGKKYSIKYKKDSPFVGKKLWEEARKEYKEFTQSLK